MGARISKRRGTLVQLIQRLNRTLNTAYLESVYQGNFFELAKRTDWVTKLPIASPSGGTASFALLYALLTLLREGRIQRILELGVGQSSMLLDQYAAHFGAEVLHIDDDQAWLVRATVTAQPGVKALYAPLRPMRVRGYDIEWYGCVQPSGLFDLLLVDGPPAWNIRTRFNRLGVLRWLPEVLSPENVVVVDDSNRRGEKVLVTELQDLLCSVGYQAEAREVVGATSATLVATRRFQDLLYL